MSLEYGAVYWNPVKRTYDLVLVAGVVVYLAIFAGLGAWVHPNATAETLLIRGLGTLAFLLLHIILCIGPLCRLNPRFLPLLYNRRHLGVTMFLLALAHGVFSLIQFHGFGDVSPVVSLLQSNTRYNSLPQFPFQLPGMLALLILFLMAATSHDFWLKNLSPATWKRLHMMVYAAYALLIGHVALGALQSETNPVLAVLLGLGLVVVISLHLAAGRKETRADAQPQSPTGEFIEVCAVSAIEENRAKVVTVGGERVAVFRYGGRVSAVSNVCAHQNGPLGEGRVIDGCITCPWHGYQYQPESGAAPPPFTEKVPSYQVKVVSGKVLLNPCAFAPGTRLEPGRIHD